MKAGPLPSSTNHCAALKYCEVSEDYYQTPPVPGKTMQYWATIEPCRPGQPAFTW